MYNLTKIQERLFGLVGFKQTQNEAYGLLPNDLTVSRSGLYVDDVHALLSRQNVHASINSNEYEFYPAWQTGTGYAKGTRVTHKMQIWESLTGTANAAVVDDVNNTFFIPTTGTGNNAEPGTGPEWMPTSYLGIYMRDIMRAAVADVITKVFIANKLNLNTRSLFQQAQLFQQTGNGAHLVIKTGRFVGIELELKQITDITLNVTKIGIQVTQRNPEFRLYLYRSTGRGRNMEFIRHWDFNIDKPGYFQWFEINDLPLSYYTDNAAGTFMFGYFEADITGQAVEVQRDLLVGPCGGCNPVEKEAFANYSEFVSVHPFGFPAGSYDGTDIEYGEQSYYYNTNFGLNLAFTAQCDLTDFVLRNSSLFTIAIQKAAAVSLMNGIAYSNENKGFLNEVKQLARYNLDRKPEHTPGLVQEYEQVLKALSFDMSGLNSRCIPCAPKRRVSHGVIGR